MVEQVAEVLKIRTWHDIVTPAIIIFIAIFAVVQYWLFWKIEQNPEKRW